MTGRAGLMVRRSRYLALDTRPISRSNSPSGLCRHPRTYRPLGFGSCRPSFGILSLYCHAFRRLGTRSVCGTVLLFSLAAASRNARLWTVCFSISKSTQASGSSGSFRIAAGRAPRCRDSPAGSRDRRDDLQWSAKQVPSLETSSRSVNDIIISTQAMVRGAAGVTCRRVYLTRNPGFPRSQLSWGRIPSSLNPDAVMLGLRLPGRRSWGSATLMGSDEQEQTRR